MGDTMGNNRTIEVLKILYYQSDEQNPITMSTIISELVKSNIKANRKTIYNDFKIIDEQTPYEVIQTKGARANYHLSNRLFEMAEVKLLIDAVQCSKFISVNKSKELLGKFEKLISNHEHKSLNRQVLIDRRNKSSNNQILYNVDKIYGAIANNKRISFQYFDYDWNYDKVYRKNGELYDVYPVCLVWDDNKYYLVSYTKDKLDTTNYRVDRMLNVELGITDDGERKSVDIAEYSKEVFNMFSTSRKREVELSIDNSYGKMINQVIDQFGDEIIFAPLVEEQHFKCKITIDVAITFFGWLSNYKGAIQILGPADVLEEYIEFLKDNLNKIKR